MQYHREGPPCLSSKELVGDWLSWVCKMVSGVQSGCLVEIRNTSPGPIVSVWPHKVNTDHLSETLAQVAKEADVVTRSRQKSRHKVTQLSDYLGIPIKSGATNYAVALELLPRSREQQASVVQLVQWVGVWLKTMLELLPESKDGNVQHQNSLTNDILRHRVIRAACLELVNALAAKFDCERVSIGIRTNWIVRLCAISNLVDFDSRKQLARSFEALMEEALDQESVVSLPQPDSSKFTTTRSHEEHYANHGGMASSTIPFELESGAMAAVTLERETGRPFTPEEIELINDILLESRPALSLVFLHDQPLRRKAAVTFKNYYHEFYATHSKYFKIGLPALLGGLLLAGFVPVDHKVVAKAIVEGSDKQTIVAPSSGFVKSSSSIAGDRVSKGQIIATLDDVDLLIEKEKWQGELSKLETSYIQALTEKDRVELGVLQARKRQAIAELDLLNQKLSRNQLRSPFDGVLVSGDLSQALGAPVETGDNLFEIASLSSFRLMLEIDEHDVAGIEAMQTGRLRLSALPGQTYGTTLKSAIPVAVSRDNSSVFRIEATLDEISEQLRPGMVGFAKITVGKKSTFGRWTMKLRNRVGLWLWSLGW